MTDETKNCGNCRFFREATEENIKERAGGSSRHKYAGGSCHRYAPGPLAGGSGQGWSDWEWPAVRPDDSCGEWGEAE